MDMISATRLFVKSTILPFSIYVGNQIKQVQNQPDIRKIAFFIVGVT